MADNTSTFNIIDYLSGMTGFVFDKSVLERIAYDCEVIDVSAYSELSEYDKDMCLIKMLETVLDSPNQMASSTNTHGAFTITIGNQIITEDVRENVKKRLRRLYKKWDMSEELAALDEGNLTWIDENEYPCTL